MNPTDRYLQIQEQVKKRQEFTLVLKDLLEEHKGTFLQIVDLHKQVAAEIPLSRCDCGKVLPEEWVRHIYLTKRLISEDEDAEDCCLQGDLRGCPSCYLEEMEDKRIEDDHEEDNREWAQKGLEWMQSEEGKQDWQALREAVPYRGDSALRDLATAIQAYWSQ